MIPRVEYFPLGTFFRCRDWVFSAWNHRYSWGFTVLGMTFEWGDGSYA